MVWYNVRWHLVKEPSATANRIAQARKLAGISPEKLGVLAGMSHGVVRMLEDGDRKNPSSETLRRLAAVLGVSVDWLMSGSGEPPTEDSVRAAVASIAPHQVEEQEPKSERKPKAGKGKAS